MTHLHPDNVAPGDSLPTRTVIDVRADHIMLVALLLRDSNPIHLDRKAARSAGLGDQFVNQGGATMAYVMNMLADWAGSRSAIRRINCSFRTNVFAGDDVEVGGRITTVAPDPDGTLVTCDVWAEVEGRGHAITGTADVLLPHQLS
jgi:acyl dehydratase